MIFEVSPRQIERLDESKIVSLLQRLITAELHKNSIPLRSGTAPAQITIPDGGDDARVSWSGGPNETDWLPSRFTIFQSKKGKTTPGGLKAETQTKSTQGSNKPILNEAIKEVISRNGAYVVVTTTPVVGTNVDKRIIKIREGIRETGYDPELLSSIQIYDCNKISNWTNNHPSVALWLNSILREVNLGGFQTFEDWGRTPDISRIDFQINEDKRFSLKGTEAQTWNKENSSITLKQSFVMIRETISSFFLGRGNAIRVVGPSGYGKTRFVHQLIASQEHTNQDTLSESQIIYCVYDDVRDRLFSIAQDIVDTGSCALLIIDDCPNDIHTRLSDIVHREGSNCHLITIGVETNAHGKDQNLIIEINRASDKLIDDIAVATNRKSSKKNASIIRDLSQGFPRMAILASLALEGGDEELSSVESLISRIVWGEHKEDQSAFESLQTLSLFTIVGLENDAANELEDLAKYCTKDRLTMFKELQRFTGRGALLRQGDYGEVQPIPLAMRLANQWLEYSPEGELENLYQSVNEEMKIKMIGRLRWLSWSEKVTRFARRRIAESLPDETALDSELGSQLLARFVHLAPDATMEHLSALLRHKSIDELLNFKTGRRHTVFALEKLAFRHQTFISAARLLLKLGASENESWSNNAYGQFVQLFQLHLSGTEASPVEKLEILDEGLSDTDTRIRKLCVDALNRMLETGRFSRNGGAEQIGAGEALEDWRPTTYVQIFDYYRNAFSRLVTIATSAKDPYKGKALAIIAEHLRAFYSIEPMFDELQALIDQLREVHPNWHAPALSLNEWLYFNRNDASKGHQNRLRHYYDELLPVGVINLIYFYSSGWAIDFHDPDICYDPDGENSFDFQANEIHKLIDKSPNDANFFFPLLDKYMSRPGNSSWIAMLRVAQHVDEPESLLNYILESHPADIDPATLSKLVQNVISGATQSDREKGLECMDIALKEPKLRSSSIEFLSAAGLDDDLLRLATNFIEDGTVEPYQAGILTLSDNLKSIDPSLIENLVRTLHKKKGPGAWAAIYFLNHVLNRPQINIEIYIECIKDSVINRALYYKENYTAMDWHYWDNLVERLLEGGHSDAEFNENLTNFIIDVIGIDDFSVQLTFDDYAQKALERLISHSPRLVWELYHAARESTDVTAKHRLPSLFRGSTSDPSSPGVLNDVPQSIYIPWMLEDKATRMPFIMSWIQLFISKTEGQKWSSEFIHFIDNNVENEETMDSLTSRLTAGSWVGSYANKLEKERDKLFQLRDLSNNPHVHRWISKTVSQIDRAIDEERRRDANREASYRA
ncbi:MULTISPECIES: hypothetical protein [unclassified Modicisalibacter]|uniref:hypothetical protein n=1 Tax=unclassified Modicisalibacter TaxID=2679913 RepID=UPI001CCCC365|nr:MULTISPECIES: hypothetical protein [unclassified Modicisalibacter]MBZ9559071.1 hypothetical protein [Modicisalibacter sp. R2A 31.J]MBZ9576818.1 hypothetical protein [Modicisalibacter sp. MOD 31.J]